MENEIVKLAASQGLWAVLFVLLLFYVLRTQEKREERLLGCLESFKGLSKDVKEVRDNLEEVKDDVKELKGRVNV